MLVLGRSADKETALQSLLGGQQDSASAQYHKWLTPEQFGQQFGATDTDIQNAVAWLQSHGFQVGDVSKGKTVIEFSGTAGQVQEALHTEIRKFIINGVEHWANSSDPQIPAALAQVVRGVATLHNFEKKPLSILSEEQFEFEAAGGPQTRPLFTSVNGLHALAPADFATIYNLKPVFQSGVDGYGVTIAVVGRSNISLADIDSFSGLFPLTAHYGSRRVIVNGIDPGDLGGGEEGEAVLDVSWAAATAPGATVELVVSRSTNASDALTYLRSTSSTTVWATS